MINLDNFQNNSSISLNRQLLQYIIFHQTGQQQISLIHLNQQYYYTCSQRICQYNMIFFSYYFLERKSNIIKAIKLV